MSCPRTFSSLNSSFTRRSLSVSLCACAALLCLLASDASAQKRRAPGGGMRAVVIDERLSALREEPDLTARLVQRLSRGRQVSIISSKRAADGTTFNRVAVTRRTRGWVQADSLASPSRGGDDERLLRLIQGSEDFDKIARAQMFLENFPRSTLRPTVLMIVGEVGEAFAARLTRDAGRRLDQREMQASGAPVHTFFLNYNGLDRFNKLGVTFTFDRQTKTYKYDGAAYREIVRRYPRSAEAVEAGKRLGALAVSRVAS